MTYPYIKFVEKDDIYYIWNKVHKRYVGEIVRERMGKFMHWQLFLYPNCGATNGCLKEISRFITTLYRRKK